MDAPRSFGSSFWALARGALLAAGFAAGLGLNACGTDPCTGPSCGGSAGTHAGGDGRSGPCESNASCDLAHGFECVLGECRHACLTHYDCARQGSCQPLAGTDRNYCVLGEMTESGRYHSRCPAADECDVDAGFACLGAGPGDAGAYCSAPCTSDADCPTSFLCETLTASDGTEQAYCVQRGFCATCETDADCLSVAGQICARGPDGVKTCTEPCDPAVDSCPWGNAASCALWDTERGIPTCAHRFGSCTGTGKGCEPCVRDADCPTGFCYGSSFTGERWCVDTSVECSCEDLPTEQNTCRGENGCPRSPGGPRMRCFDPASSTSPLAQHCFAANTTGTSLGASPQSGCWEK